MSVRSRSGRAHRPAAVRAGLSGASRWRVPLIAVVAVVLAADVSAVISQGSAAPHPAGAAQRFLDRFVEADGRVVRHDQGGDTVSEGQAYALLAAVGLADAPRFAAIWDWTRTHLQRPDGLFSWRWKDGRVLDPEAASDADLDITRALLEASERFDEPRYGTEAHIVAAAVRNKETEVVAGDRLLLPGPWALGARPVRVNPSYLAPATFALLGWVDMAGSANRVVGLGKAPHDWVLVGEDGTVRPDGKYGYEAVRVPVRLAESPDAADRALAASLWPVLRNHPFTPRHPAAMVAAAAAAAAAGEHEAARRLMERGEREDRRRPTYYGSAWLALADLWLDLK